MPRVAHVYTDDLDFDARVRSYTTAPRSERRYALSVLERRVARLDPQLVGAVVGSIIAVLAAGAGLLSAWALWINNLEVYVAQRFDQLAYKAINDSDVATRANETGSALYNGAADNTALWAILASLGSGILAVILVGAWLNGRRAIYAAWIVAYRDAEADEAARSALSWWRRRARSASSLRDRLA